MTRESEEFALQGIFVAAKKYLPFTSVMSKGSVELLRRMAEQHIRFSGSRLSR